MKVTYRGFEIEALRNKKENHIVYSIIRKMDGLMILGGFNYEERTLMDFVTHLKGVVDDYHEDPTAYEVGDTNFGDDLPPDDLDEEPAEIDANAEPLEDYEDEI